MPSPGNHSCPKIYRYHGIEMEHPINQHDVWMKVYTSHQVTRCFIRWKPPIWQSCLRALPIFRLMTCRMLIGSQWTTCVLGWKHGIRVMVTPKGNTDNGYKNHYESLWQWIDLIDDHHPTEAIHSCFVWDILTGWCLIWSIQTSPTAVISRVFDKHWTYSPPSNQSYTLLSILSHKVKWCVPEEPFLTRD